MRIGLLIPGTNDVAIHLTIHKGCHHHAMSSSDSRCCHRASKSHSWSSDSLKLRTSAMYAQSLPKSRHEGIHDPVRTGIVTVPCQLWGYVVTGEYKAVTELCFPTLLADTNVGLPNLPKLRVDVRIGELTGQTRTHVDNMQTSLHSVPHDLRTSSGVGVTKAETIN
ncbi:hypothetical protein OH76DRAFT_1410181 [Lentinus brumalis]|uniref:Uncharacterized protein n=1 Tax=Lentinus brumalis TaxID=2498619 RepID=A0A371CSY1_9APHY|nr:hypothetical protein OH76DRAFT_1410181 [Polyporus brumalis]